MTLILYGLLAQTVLILVIAACGGLYMRYWFHKLYTTVITFKQTASTAADEQHTQTALLQAMLRQLTEQTKVAVVAAGPRWAQAKVKEANQRRRQELTSFLINSGFFTGLDNQKRLVMDLTPNALTMIDDERYPHQNVPSLLGSIVKAADEYDQIPTLCYSAAAIFNSSQTGGEFAVRCAGWGIRLPPHEGDADGT